MGTGEPAYGLRAPSPGRALDALSGAISGASPAPARRCETLLLPVQARALVGSAIRRQDGKTARRQDGKTARRQEQNTPIADSQRPIANSAPLPASPPVFAMEALIMA